MKIKKTYFVLLVGLLLVSMFVTGYSLMSEKKSSTFSIQEVDADLIDSVLLQARQRGSRCRPGQWECVAVPPGNGGGSTIYFERRCHSSGMGYDRNRECGGCDIFNTRCSGTMPYMNGY